MKNNLISIIVPVYNVDKYLDECIKSIINQTYENLEVILIDDGSTDDSGKICDKWKANDKRIKVIHKKNGGVSSARNLGLENANGEYIGFVDGDDTISDNMFEILYNNMIKNDADISMCNYNIVRNGNITYHKHNIENDLLIIEDKNTFYDLLNRDYYKGYLWNKLFKKNIIKYNKFDEEIHMCEDLLFVAQIAKRCNRYCFDNRRLYNYLIHNGSAYNSKINEKHLTVVDAYSKINNIVRSEAKEKVYYEYLNSEFLWLNDICKNYTFKDNKTKLKYKELNASLYKKVIKSKYTKNHRLENYIRYNFYFIYKVAKTIKNKLEEK